MAVSGLQLKIHLDARQDALDRTEKDCEEYHQCSCPLCVPLNGMSPVVPPLREGSRPCLVVDLL